MADKKISQMTLLSATDLVASTDYLPIVDPSEPVAADQNKRILVQSILTNATTNGLLPTIAQVNPLAKAISVAMTAAASGSNGIQALDNANLDMGTNDFSWFGVRMFADYTPSAAIEVERKHDGTNGWIFTILTTGILRLQINSLTYDSTVAPTITDGAFVAFGFSVVRSSASTAGSVTFYVNGVVVGASVAIVAAAPTSVDNASVYYANGGSATRTAGRWNSGILYNRALTAAEQLALYNNGPALADVASGALIPSQTAVTTYDFSAGTDSWSGTSATLTGNIDGIGGKDNNLRAVSTGSSFGRWTRTYSNAQLLKSGRVVLEFYRPSSNATVTGVQLRLTVGTSHPGNSAIQSVQIPANTWTTVIFTVSPTTTTDQTALSIYFIDAASSASNNTSGDTIYMASGGTYTQTGVVAWWDARDAQSNTGQVFDRSGNKNHAMIPAAGATIINKPTSDARQVRWTNSWSETSELQYIGGVNQAILPAAAYIESIIGVITSSGGSGVQDIIIGDGSDTDRYVTITTGLATGTTSFTLANRTTDGTNLKLTVDPDATCTMAIAWTITYRVLE